MCTITSTIHLDDAEFFFRVDSAECRAHGREAMRAEGKCSRRVHLHGDHQYMETEVVEAFLFL